LTLDFVSIVSGENRNRWAFICVVYILDEFPFEPAPPKQDRISWFVFKRPHLVSVEMFPVRNIARTPPPAFLFPNQRCQRPEPPKRPNRLTPGCGGGGYVVATAFPVNRLFALLPPSPI